MGVASYSGLVLAVHAISSTLAFTLTPTGQTVTLDGIPYYVPANPVSSIPAFGTTNDILQAATEAGGLLPITVVSANSTAYSANDFGSTVAGYLAQDDVYSEGFLEAVYVQYITASRTLSRLGLKSSGLNISGPVATTYTAKDTAIPNGPYFVSATGAVYEAWRLYSDFQGAFTETAVATGDEFGTYAVLPANVGGQSLAVAVPSRLYFTPSEDQPLAGVRVGVKDIYDIAGLRTSNGNRAWYHFYPPANKTALPIQRLIDAGAIIVGKMKTSQFANGETATADWVDYHEPFNPRGDGYQDTSSSSSGPGAGAGAYDWLDLTVGSDTGGSIRGPSAVQGLYGNRPTVGLVPLDGVMPMNPQSDTAGFLTRHPAIWQAAAQAMYLDNVTISHSYPSLVRTLDFPTTAETDGDALLLNFLGNLTAFLNGSSQTWDLSGAWNTTGPSNTSYVDLVNITYPVLIGKHEVLNLRDPFFAAYGAAHDGRQPAIDPVPTTRWNWSDQFPTSIIDEAVANLTVFQEWFDTVLAPDNATCSDSLMLYVGSNLDSGAYTITYRNVYRDAPGIPYDDTSYVGNISPYWGGPDYVLPLGQGSYFSEITKHEEFLPVTVDIMAARGCDGMLFGLVQDLVAAGILDTPTAGYSDESGGDVLFRRGVGL